jgi:hypothetical protein
MRTPADWSRIRTLFQGALEVSPDQRTTFLRDRTGGDDTIRREVESLFAAHLEASAFLSFECLARVEDRTMFGRDGDDARGGVRAIGANHALEREVV